MKIGIMKYRFDYYSVVRNIVHKLPEAEYVPVNDSFSLRRRLALKINQVAGKQVFSTFDLNNQFDDFELNRVDLLHFSNGISYGRTPWVSSFETVLPRFSSLMTRHQGRGAKALQMDSQLQRGFDALAGPSCKAIISWSECTARIQRGLLEQLPGPYREMITPKIRVIHPPQPILVEQPPQEVPLGRSLRFGFVGEAIFRKGGREILQAFEKLVKYEGLNLQLVLISSLRIEAYASGETEEDVVWARKMIADNSDWIEYYDSLPNDQTLEKLKSCDVALLPSWADTYGFSVLEAQACACPVISTDIRALPEINNEKVGWLISVPKNVFGEALYNTAEERATLSACIQSGLERIVREIASDPSVILPKARACLERLRLGHDPLAYADSLRRIYAQALS